VLNPEQICGSFGIEIMDLHSLTAPTTARKEAAAQMARKSYEKQKTRADQVAVLLEGAVKAATDAAAAAPHPTAAATPQRQKTSSPGAQKGTCSLNRLTMLGLHGRLLFGRLARALTKSVFFQISKSDFIVL
jgi:hypothetical protein